MAKPKDVSIAVVAVEELPAHTTLIKGGMTAIPRGHQRTLVARMLTDAWAAVIRVRKRHPALPNDYVIPTSVGLTSNDVVAVECVDHIAGHRTGLVQSREAGMNRRGYGGGRMKSVINCRGGGSLGGGRVAVRVIFCKRFRARVVIDNTLARDCGRVDV